VDNVTTSAAGEVIVAEDGGDMQIVAISAKGVAPIMQIEGHRQSEVTGPAFDPSGTRLYFSSQRGASGFSSDGVTYEVSGPFSGY
jgi:secreted PhoX family phosphatase